MLRIWWRLSLLGLIGAASFLLVPLETWVPTNFDPAVLRLLATVQPTILAIAAAALGAWAAPKVSLHTPAVRAWADHRPVLPELRRQFPAALVTGLVVAAILLGYFAVIRPTPEGAVLMRFAVPLPIRVLYGGLVEELLLRWGLMSFLAWLAWRLAGRPTSVPSWIYWIAIVVAALLFGAGHLPALSFFLPNPPTWIVALVLAANFAPGVMFGWLFWRRGLEAAMMAHGLAHLFAWAATLVM